MTDTTPADAQCSEVPLIELLRRVPRDARLWALTSMGTEHYPVGRLCHEAADALEQARAASQPAQEPVSLQRWGVKWKGQTEPFMEQMPDGHWTPWHIANEALQRAAPPAAQQQVEPVGEKRIANAIHYPACWDTAAYPELDDALAELFQAFKCQECAPADGEAVRLLRKSKRGHYYCEDSWYSCPKAEDGCADESRGIDCDCGADEWNAEIDAYLAKARQSSA